jgi:hypothetical protein
MHIVNSRDSRHVLRYGTGIETGEGVDAGLDPQLRFKPRRDLLGHEFVAFPEEQDRALFFVCEPGMLGNLMRAIEHAHWVNQRLDEGRLG